MLSWFSRLTGFFSSSISKKIIIPYAVLTLVMAALGIFIVVRLVAGSFEARLQNQLRESAQVVADEVVNRERMRLEIERVVVSTIGVAEALVNRDIGQLVELVSPVIANARGIDSIIMVDTQGTELVRFHREGSGVDAFVTTTTNSGLNLWDWPAVQQVLSNPDGEKRVQLVSDPALDSLIIYTVGPVLTDNGTVGAALVGTYLNNELSTLQNLALAQLTLFGDSGEVLATTFAINRDDLRRTFTFFTPERYRQVVQNNRVTLLDQLSVAGETNSGIVNIRDQGYRLAYAPFVLRDDVVGVYAVALPTNFITDTTDQSRNVLIGLFSLGVITVFGIGYVVSRRISRPILRLVKTSQAISAGDLDQRTGVQSNDEIGILATTFDDMTGKLQHLLKLQEEEASKLNAILNSIADGVIVQDARGKVLVTNPAAEKILAAMDERSLLDSLGQYDAGQPEPAGQSATPEKLLPYFKNLVFGAPHRFEAGNKMLSAVSAPVMTNDQQQLGTVVVLRDITREHEAEKLKDDFITSMSHELRTPLTAIKGYNELLKLTAAQQLDERQLNFVETIDDNVNDLLEIIQQMLDLSQIDAGSLGIDREPVDVNELLEAELESWADKMEERELTFSVSLPEQPVWVAGDFDRLGRVVHNLVKNSYQYTLPGGRVTVNVAKNGENVQIDVVDTGVGISEESQKYLFTRFFRAIHEEHTFEVSGAGLGLYTSRAIIEAHHGKIWVRSRLNEGSVFSFSLPLIDPDTFEADEAI
ncbi:MAG: ATP-binding protein [Anaerolineae bacterium]